MRRFRARQVKEIDAIQWTGDNYAELRDAGVPTRFVLVDPARVGLFDSLCQVETMHGWVTVEVGSWVANGGADWYPLDPLELARLYEPVDG